MAFKIATGPKTVWWPVDISVPLDDGRAEIQKIDAQFEIITQDEADRIVSGREEQNDLLLRVLTGLRQRKKDPKAEDEPILDEHGAALSFEDAKNLMHQTVYIRSALYVAYGRAANGQGRVKNS